MREWLFRLLGAPQPMVIEFDAVAIDAAQPGSLIILHTSLKPGPQQ